MKNIRIILLCVIILVLLLAAASCSTIGNSTLAISVDPVLTTDTACFTVLDFVDNEDGTTYSYTVPAEGSLTVEHFPKGQYSLVINRAGALQEISVTVDKGDTDLDFRLFYDAKGSLAEGTHYIISTAEQLTNLRYMQGATAVFYYHLNNDIDLSGLEFPVISGFNGILDGRYYGINTGTGYSILNLTVNQPNSDNIGFVGINEGFIKNITFTSVSVTGKEKVGAVAGENNGVISGCNASSGAVTGGNYVGGVAGIDRGSLSNCQSSVSINCDGYYGKIAGISYSNPTLGAYGIRPSASGATPITEEMSALTKYLTAIDNWYAMDSRAVLQKNEVTVDLTDTVHEAVNQVYEAMPSFSIQQIALGFIKNNDIWATENIYMRRIYEGASEDGLDRLLVSGSGYTKATSFDSIINSIMAVPQFAEMLGDLDLQFPFGFAAYYNESDNERLEVQITDDAYVGDDGIVSYTMGDEVHVANITDDLNELAEYEEIDQADVTKILNYIAELKGYLMYLSTLDMDAEGVVKGVSDESHANGVYKFTLTVDPDIAYKYIVDRIQRAIDEELAGTVAEGTVIEAVFKKDISLTVEIWDNGNLKSVILDDLDADIIIHLTDDTIVWIQDKVAEFDFDGDGNGGDVTGFYMNSVKVEVSGWILDRYSYSLTDTDMDIYLPEFDKTKVRMLDEYYESEQNRQEEEE